MSCLVACALIVLVSARPIRAADDDTQAVKAATPQLDGFLALIQATAPTNRPLSLLDVGCGTGGLARRLYERGFSVLGIAVNPDAISAARRLAIPADASGRGLRFEEADFAADRSPRIDGGLL